MHFVGALIYTIHCCFLWLTHEWCLIAETLGHLVRGASGTNSGAERQKHTSAAPSVLSIERAGPPSRCGLDLFLEFTHCVRDSAAGILWLPFFRVFVAGWQKVAAETEEAGQTERGKERSKRTAREAEPRAKDLVRRSVFLAGLPRSAAHSCKINWNRFLVFFLFFQPVNYLQIIEKQLFTLEPTCVIMHQETNVRLSGRRLFRSPCHRSHTRSTQEIRRQGYNDKEIFIKPFFFSFLLLVIAAPTRVFTKK